MAKHAASLPEARSESRVFYGYTVAVAAFIVMAVMHAAFFSFGVFFKPVSEDFGWTRAETSGALSMGMVVLGTVTIIVGRLNDKLGPRILVTVCGVLFGLGYILLSGMYALWQLYLFYGVLVALGMTGGFVPAMSTVARWFIRRRGLMTGIVAAGVGAGAMVGAPLAGWLISTYGWRTSYLLAGVIILVLLVIFAQFLKRDPEDLGQLPYGSSRLNGTPRKQKIPLSEPAGFSLQKSMRTRQFWMLGTAYFFSGATVQSIFVHIVPYATDKGIATVSAANILTIVGAVNIIGRVMIGIMSDRRGNKPSLVLCFGFLLASMLWLQNAAELWMLYLFAAIFGVGFAGAGTLLSPMVAELFGIRAHGTILGMLTFVMAIGAAAGPFISGYIFDVSGGYRLAFMVSLAFATISLTTISLLKPAKERIHIVETG
ncbi:MAG: MFS transporter [Chloroflexi bacterium]|nr:MFS transporter [Chloroflexota bacterium]